MQSDLGRLRSEAEAVDSGLTEVDETIADMNTSMQCLTAALAALETRTVDGERPVGPPWWAITGWFVAGAAALLARRRRSAEREPDDDLDPGEVSGRGSPDDRDGSEPDLVTFDLQ